MKTQWIAGTGFSRGIGSAFAKQIQLHGYKLFHIGRKPCGFEDEFLMCDLSLPISSEFLKILNKKLHDKNIFGFFYGAGIFPLLTYNENDIEQKVKFWESQAQAMRVNYLSCAQLVEEILPFILNAGQKNEAAKPAAPIENADTARHIPFVAHISSMAAVDPLPGFEFYGTTKVATLKYFEHLAKKFDPGVLACLALHPGTVKTDMFDDVMSPAEYQHLPAVDILKHEMQENRVISAEQSAQLIADFLFDAHNADTRKKSHGKLYIADQKKLFTER